MDPVSIVGVAAAAIQFYTFTTSVAKATCRVVSSSNSLPADANDLEAVSARFKEIVEVLDKQVQAANSQAEGVHLSDMELQLQKTCADCLPKARMLLAASSELAVNINKSGQMQKLWKALKKEFKQGDIESLTATLSKLQSDIFHITIACSWDCAKKTQNAIANLSQQMTTLQSAVLMSIQTGTSQPITSAFVQDIAAAEAIRSQSVLDNVDWSGGRLDQVWDELKLRFSGSSWPRKPMDTSESSSQRHQRLAQDIISQLKFGQMATRHDTIAKPHASTFEWIWHAEPEIPEAAGKPKWLSFPAWLEGPSTTPYWVTGRPGSGKSTLMRFIEDHGKLQHHLSQWKPELRLQILSYYAWNPGSDSQQKSIEGLVRTILFQLLESEPHLLPVVLPRRWAFSTATLSSLYPPDFEAEDLRQLEEGLVCLLSTTRPSLKLMILVDGLDEFQVAPKELIRTVKSINKTENVKLCVASRPWIEFKDSFRTWPHLKIHDLTEDDIDKFIHDKFADSVAARERHGEATSLRNEIQKNAGGVFQWVTVVVNFTLDKLESGDPLQHILNILRQLPKDLSDLYTAIWDRLVPERREQAREVFMLKSISRSILRLDYIKLWCVNERYSSVSGIELLKDTAKDPEVLRNIVVRFLSSRTLGLLELDRKGEVTFLHRTIPEWLTANNILGQSALQAHMSSLQGLCVIGGHIAPFHDHFRMLLLYSVAYHLTIIDSLFMHTLSDVATQGIVNWLHELEQSAVPPNLAGLEEFGIIGQVSSSFGIVDLAALCGFVPFVEGHLEQNRSLPRKDLFESCVRFKPPGIGLSYGQSTREPLERRLDLVRLCLKHGVTVYEYDKTSHTMKECSMKTMARKFRRFADDPNFKFDHDYRFTSETLTKQEISEYCRQVASIIENSPNYRKASFIRFKEEASSSLVYLKRKLAIRQKKR